MVLRGMEFGGEVHLECAGELGRSAEREVDILAQHLVLPMGLVRASGTAKAMNLASNAGALAGFAAGGAVVWALGAPLALASIAGNLLGVRLAVRIGASAVRNFLYLVLAGLLATLIWRFVI